MSETTLVRTDEGGVEIPAKGTWVPDKAHTRIGFVARHLMVTKVHGIFRDFDIKAQIGDTPETSSVEVVIRSASLDTGTKMRDDHLLSADFFDVGVYPTITFKSTKVERTGPDTLALTGDLTVGKVTRSLTLDVRYEGLLRDPGGGVHASFSATAEILREDWGIAWNVAIESGGFLVGPKVKIEIDASLVPEDQG